MKWQHSLILASAMMLVACDSAPPVGVATSSTANGTLPPEAVKISISDAEVFEGDGDTPRALKFVVRLSQAVNEEVRVSFIASAGSALAGTDFSPTSGVLVFAPHQTQQVLQVIVSGDCEIEPNEQLFMTLSQAVNAEVERATANGTINNDDALTALLPGTGGPLLAGAAEDVMRVPVGVPLGGYLRPPIAGDFFPAFDDFQDGEAAAFFDELARRLPDGSDHDGAPLVPAPDESRAASSPYATYSPPSRGYFDSLITKAVALDNGEKIIVIVKTDLIAMLDELPIEIGKRVAERTGIDLGDGLIMTATHTHDGPGAVANNSVRYFWLAVDVFQPEIYELLVEEITRVVIMALDNRVPARFGYAMGQENRASSLNSFRRGRDIYTDERKDELDVLRRRIGIMRIDEIDANGQAVRPLAAILNYAAHGIAFSVDNFLFSGDVLSAAEREFEAGFDEPMIAMFVQSAGGDVSPRADGKPTLVRIERFGKLLAPQALNIYSGINNFDDRPALRTITQRVILSLDRLGYTGSEYPYEYGAAQCNNGGAEDCIASPAPEANDLADNGVGENQSFLPQDTRIAIARIGSALVLVQPGEPLAEYGLRLLEATPFGSENTFIFGLAQDHAGYILPDLKDDWLQGGTEGTTTFWGWKQGGRLLDATVELMDALSCAPEPEDEFEVNYLAVPVVPAEPTVSPRAGRLVTQTIDIKRFENTPFAWEGGDPVLDLPTVTMEIQESGGSWTTARRSNGKPLNTYYEMHLAYELSSGAHIWTLEFEAPLDWPLGNYRFNAAGQARNDVGDAAYQIISDAFTVSPASNLALTSPLRSGNEVSAEFSYPILPTNYRVIDAEVQTNKAAPVRSGSVSFNFGVSTLVDDSPEIIVRDGVPVAVYSVESPLVPLTVSGNDEFGNISQ